MFQKDIEYKVAMLENEQSKNEILNKHVHVYNASCSCPGNTIKIDVTGEFIKCESNGDGEYLYTIKCDDGTENIVTTRSTFIKFMIID